jgi:ABC-type transporter Mla MlaB component
MRISVHDDTLAITLKLEGSLAGPRVRVLEECWQSTLAGLRRPMVYVDLSGVTFIDDAGRACLAAMHSQGVAFIAPDAMTKDIVAEITQGQSLGRESGKSEGESRPSRDRGETF